MKNRFAWLSWFTPRSVSNASWLQMATAPRDGTVVEIENAFGLMPHYGLHQFDPSLPGWVDIAQMPAKVFYQDESKLRWRPYSGDLKNYVDPTGGAQDAEGYYDAAIARESGVSVSAIEAYRAKNKADRKKFGDGTNAPTYPAGKWNQRATLRRGVWVDDDVPRPSDDELDRFRESARTAKRT